MVNSSGRSIGHSSEPQTSTVSVSTPRPKYLGHRYSNHKLVGSHCLYLLSYGSLSQGDPKIRQCNCLIVVIAPAWPGMPWFFGPSAALSRDPTSATSVNNSSQTIPQLCVSQQFTTSQPPSLVSRSEQLQEQGFCGGGRDNWCPTKVINKNHLQAKWALFEKICWTSPVFTGTIPKVPGMYQNGTLLLCLMSSQKHPLSL